MVGIYAVTVAAGFVALAGLLVVTAARDDDIPWERRAVGVVGGVIGFGMGGISASFAGWAGTGAFIAAVAGALAGTGYSHWARTQQSR